MPPTATGCAASPSWHDEASSCARTAAGARLGQSYGRACPVRRDLPDHLAHRPAMYAVLWEYQEASCQDQFQALAVPAEELAS